MGVALTVLLVFTTVDNDPFKSNDVTFKKYNHVVKTGECLDEIFARYYSSNEVFIDWDTYRTKHYDYNSALIINGRPLQPGDNVVIYTVHKKKG